MTRYQDLVELASEATRLIPAVEERAQKSTDLLVRDLLKYFGAPEGSIKATPAWDEQVKEWRLTLRFDFPGRARAVQVPMGLRPVRDVPVAVVPNYYSASVVNPRKNTEVREVFWAREDSSLSAVLCEAIEVEVRAQLIDLRFGGVNVGGKIEH